MSTYLPGPHQTALEGWQSAYDASQERPAPFTTLSGEPIRPLYTEADLPADPAAAIGLPGQYPYTRGVYASMYRGRLWTMRQFAGFGTAEETNERFRYLLDHGQTGLSTAFDMPSLMGHDSDSPRSLGEVGREGVAVDTVDDMQTLFRGIDLGDVSVSMTINAPRRSCSPTTSWPPSGRASGPSAWRGRSRRTSSRSTSPRRSGASRSTRRCGCSAT
jgi:methylmalonyl-CoA mutase N-terminal domain/subunit